jgi:hypothetical protein
MLARVKVDLSYIVNSLPDVHIASAMQGFYDKYAQLNTVHEEKFSEWLQARLKGFVIGRGTLPHSWSIVDILERFNRTIKDDVSSHTLMNVMDFIKAMEPFCASWSAFGDQRTPAHVFEVLPSTPEHVCEWVSALWRESIDFYQEQLHIVPQSASSSAQGSSSVATESVNPASRALPVKRSTFSDNAKGFACTFLLTAICSCSQIV